MLVRYLTQFLPRALSVQPHAHYLVCELQRKAAKRAWMNSAHNMGDVSILLILCDLSLATCSIHYCWRLAVHNLETKICHSADHKKSKQAYVLTCEDVLPTWKIWNWRCTNSRALESWTLLYWLWDCHIQIESARMVKSTKEFHFYQGLFLMPW